MLLPVVKKKTGELTVLEKSFSSVYVEAQNKKDITLERACAARKCVVKGSTFFCNKMITWKKIRKNLSLSYRTKTWIYTSVKTNFSYLFLEHKQLGQATNSFQIQSKRPGHLQFLQRWKTQKLCCNRIIIFTTNKKRMKQLKIILKIFPCGFFLRRPAWKRLTTGGRAAPEGMREL